MYIPQHHITVTFLRNGHSRIMWLGPKILNNWCTNMTLLGTTHMLYIVYMGNFYGKVKMNDPCGKTMHRRIVDSFNVFQCCRIKCVKHIVKTKWLYLTLCSFLFLIVFILLLWLLCLLARSWTIATLLTYTVRNQPHIKWVDCKVYNAQWNTTCIN